MAAAPRSRKRPAQRTPALLALCAGLAVVAVESSAQAPYPARAVRAVVPYPAGGPTDVIGRLAAQSLSETLGQQFVVENVSGASGARGATMVAAAPPDGHTIMFATNDLAFVPTISSKVGYDPIRQFAPVSLISRSPSVILVHPSVPARTLHELIALARADPAKYGFAGMSSGQNFLASEKIFRLALKLPIVRIPFPGAAPILTSTVGAHTLVGYIGLPSAMPFIRDGTLRALAVTSPERFPIIPDVPTLAESGFQGLETELVIGAVAPAGTPPAIIDLLSRSLAQFAAKPQTRERLAAFAFTPVGSTPEAFAVQIKTDVETAAAIVKEAGITVD
jgi:tripartite-type tricarboxylate transporter receptor subunit TctC